MTYLTSPASDICHITLYIRTVEDPIAAPFPIYKTSVSVPLFSFYNRTGPYSSTLTVAKHFKD